MQLPNYNMAEKLTNLFGLEENFSHVLAPLFFRGRITETELFYAVANAPEDLNLQFKSLKLVDEATIVDLNTQTVFRIGTGKITRRHYAPVTEEALKADFLQVIKSSDTVEGFADIFSLEYSLMDLELIRIENNQPGTEPYVTERHQTDNGFIFQRRTLQADGVEDISEEFREYRDIQGNPEGEYIVTSSQWPDPETIMQVQLSFKPAQTPALAEETEIGKPFLFRSRVIQDSIVVTTDFNNAGLPFKRQGTQGEHCIWTYNEHCDVSSITKVNAEGGCSVCSVKTIYDDELNPQLIGLMGYTEGVWSRTMYIHLNEKSADYHKQYVSAIVEARTLKEDTE